MTPHVWKMVPDIELKFLGGEITRDYICTICNMRVTGLWRGADNVFHEAPGEHPYNNDFDNEYIEDCDLAIVKKVQNL